MENKFNYIIGVLLVVLLVAVVYIGGKVNLLEEDLAVLYDRVGAIESLSFGLDDYYLGYEDELYLDDAEYAGDESLDYYSY